MAVAHEPVDDDAAQLDVACQSAAAWLDGEIIAGRLSEEIDADDLAVIAGILVRGMQTCARRARRGPASA